MHAIVYWTLVLCRKCMFKRKEGHPWGIDKLTYSHGLALQVRGLNANILMLAPTAKSFF